MVAPKRKKTRTAATTKRAAEIRDLKGQIAAVHRSQAVIEFELDGTIITANENSLSALGYQLDEVVGRHHRIFVADDVANSSEYQNFWADLRRGEYLSDEFKRYRKDGTAIWIQATYNPVFDEDGSPVKVIKFATDITTSKLLSMDHQGQIEAIDRSQAVIEYDLDGTVICTNDSFLQMFGYRASELEGRKHRILVCEEADDTEVWAAIGCGEVFRADCKRRLKDGGEIWIHTSYNPIFDDCGMPVKVVQYASDITDQMADRDTALRLQRVIEDSESAYMMVDRDFLVTYVNPATRELLTKNETMFQKEFPGFVAAEIVGSCIDQFHKNPQHQRKLLADPNNLPFRTDIQVGPLSFALNVTAAYNTNGEYVGNSLLWRDVTEQRKSEARDADYRGQIQAISRSQAVIKFGLDGTILEANDNFLDLTGYQSDEIVGKHHRMFVDDETVKSSAYDEMWARLRRGEVLSGEFSRFGKGGKQRWIQASYNPIFDVDGKPVQVVKYATDISATKKMELQVKQQQDLERQQIEAQQEKVSELLAAVNAVAAGDLSVQMPDLGDDAIGKVGVGVGKAVTAIRDAMTRVRDVASLVASSSVDLASASERISSGAQDQASSLEQTAASLEQITSAVKQNTDNSQQAQQLSSGSREVAESGGSVVGEAVGAMTAINSASKKIAEIITTIDEIAFQTNLLALNAAVEAARAGEQGRGFAVVASEVRNLAQRSAGAAKEIKNLIQDSVAKVENGTELVNKSGNTLQEIVTSVKRVADIVAEISAASTEQLAGIEQVNGAVSQMDRVTQTNAAQTEQMTGTSKTLLSHSEQLRQLVSAFRLGGEGVVVAATNPATAPAANPGWAPAAAPVVSVVGNSVPHELDLIGVDSSAADGEFVEF